MGGEKLVGAGALEVVVTSPETLPLFVCVIARPWAVLLVDRGTWILLLAVINAMRYYSFHDQELPRQVDGEPGTR